MGKLPVYTSREQARSAGYLTQSDITGEQAGAGIGRAVAGLGSAISGLGGAMAERQNKKAASQAQIAIANFTGEAQMKLTEMSVNAPPDGSGVYDGFQGWFNDRFDEMSVNAPNEELRQYYAERKATLGSTFFPKAYEFEATKAAGNAQEQTKDALSGIYGSIQRDPSLFYTFHEQGKLIVDNHYALTPDAREELAKSFNQTSSQTFFDTVIRNATTLEEIDVVKKQIANGDDPIAKLLAPADLTALTDSVATRENSIKTGVVARVKADADAAMEQLKGGQPLDPQYLNDLSKSVMEFGTPDTQNKFFEQLYTSKFQFGMKGWTKGQLDDATKFGKPIGDMNFFWRSADRGEGYAQISSNDKRILAVNPDLTRATTTAFKSLGIDEIRINSGARDHKHNKAVGGAKGSQHLSQNAFDIDVSKYSHAERVQMIEALSAAGVTGIGVYDTAIHVDMRQNSRASWGPDYTNVTVPGWAREVTDRHLKGAIAKVSGGVSNVSAPVQYQSMYEASSQKHGIPAAVLIAQGARESGNWAPDVVSGERTSVAGAIGVSQFMPGTAKRFNIDPKDPAQSIDAQGQYMRILLDRYNGNMSLALAAYNWGEGNVDKVNGDLSKAPKETRDYVKYVMGVVNGDEAPPSGMTEYYRVKAAKDARAAYDTGMKGDATKFVIDYVPQFFPDDAPDMNTGEGLGARFKGVDAARGYLGEPGIPLLTADEVSALSARIDQLDGAGKLAMAKQIQSELGSNAKEVYKLLEKSQPDMAFAGLMLAHDDSSAPVAYELIQGREAIALRAANTGEKEMSPEKFLTDMFKDLEAEDRLPTDIEQALADYPKRMVDVQRAADNLYALRAMRGGFSNEFKAEEYRAALEDVMGATVDEVNGAPTILPKGVSSDQLEAVLGFVDQDDLVRLSVNGGAPVYAATDREGNIVPTPIDPDDFADEAQLEAYGPDIYAVKLRLGKDYLFDSKKIGETANPADALYLMKLSAEEVGAILGSASENVVTRGGAPAPEGTIMDKMKGTVDPDLAGPDGQTFVVPTVNTTPKAVEVTRNQLSTDFPDFEWKGGSDRDMIAKTLVKTAASREQQGLPALSIADMLKLNEVRGFLTKNKIGFPE